MKNIKSAVKGVGKSVVGKPIKGSFEKFNNASGDIRI